MLVLSSDLLDYFALFIYLSLMLLLSLLEVIKIFFELFHQFVLILLI